MVEVSRVVGATLVGAGAAVVEGVVGTGAAEVGGT